MTHSGRRFWARGVAVVGTVVALTAAGTMLVPASAANVAVTGVLWLDGAPVANGTVSLPAPYSQSVRTGGDGRFTVPVPAGEPVSMTFGVAYGYAQQPYAVTSRPFTVSGTTDLARVVLPPLESTTYRVLDDDGTSVSEARVGRDSPLSLTSTNWADAGAPLSAALVAASGTWFYSGETNTNGETLVEHPRLTAGQPRPISNVVFQQSTGAVWPGDMAGATGQNPVVVRVPGFQVGPPTAPENVRVNNDANQPLYVYWGSSWSEGSTVTGYTVTAQPGGHTVTIPAVTDSASNATNFPDLRDGTYTFSVIAHSAAGPSPVSATGPIRVVGVPDPTQSVSAVKALAPGEVTVTWAPVTTTAVTGYKVSLSNGVNQVVPADVTSTALRAAEGQTVTATVVALNRWLESSPVTSLPLTMPTSVVPAPPAVPTPTPVPVQPLPASPAFTGQVGRPTAVLKGSKVIVSWATPTDGRLPITRYRVVRRPGKALTVPGSKRRVVVRGLRPGLHRFAVIAYSAAGAGKISKYVKVRVT